VGTVPRADVLAYFTERDEEEIIARPADVTVTHTPRGSRRADDGVRGELGELERFEDTAILDAMLDADERPTRYRPQKRLENISVDRFLAKRTWDPGTDERLRPAVQ
jgi:hypothetical protein